MARLKAFINGCVCFQGRQIEATVYIDQDSGLITSQPAEMPTDFVDLKGGILAPAYIDLQTNGCLGFHFTDFDTAESYSKNLARVSRHLVSRGVGAFYVTLPTVHRDMFQKILPHLMPRKIENGANLLGAHCEGPFLNSSKKGAHDATLMEYFSETSLNAIYGDANNLSNIKLITLAPELPGSIDLISALSRDHSIIVSLGHSSADYDTAHQGLEAGATCLTHVFNAMPPLHHRIPGLAGSITSSQAPFYSLIADGIHLHPATLTMAYRANPERCILITDSIEMAGMPDGIYPGHAQVPHPQRKQGNKITIEGTETLIGSCSSIDECVRNLKEWSGCSLAEAVRCATENIAELMSLTDRGVVEPGRRADFVVLDTEGVVQETYVEGRKVFEARP